MTAFLFEEETMACKKKTKKKSCKGKKKGCK